jgi:hypothetical protein
VGRSLIESIAKKADTTASHPESLGMIDMPQKAFRAIVLSMLIAVTWVGHSAHAQNYSDIWWGGARESGWGVTIADHETNIFAVYYTYGLDGRATWYALSGGTFSQGKRIFTGDMYATTGPHFAVEPFNAAQVATRKVGTATFDFAPPGAPAGSATFSYTINGVTQTKTITRFSFGSANAAWPRDMTDIYWNAAESGWGYALAQQGNNMFGVFYNYRSDGTPQFVTMSGGKFITPAFFEGDLYTATGPYFGNSTFDTSRVVATPVGKMSMAYCDTTLEIKYTINGVTQSKSLTRLPFGQSKLASVSPIPGVKSAPDAGKISRIVDRKSE